MGLSEKEIIRKIKNGEIDWFRFIVEKYTIIMYQYIVIRIFNKEDIEDLIQNIFISFYKSIERFDENKPVKPYLFKIAINELKMYYRSKKQTVSLNEDIYLSDDRLQDNILDIDNYLKLLNNQEKEIFIRLNEGYKIEEIAKEVKKPINTVKSIIRRARKKLLVNRY